MSKTNYGKIRKIPLAIPVFDKEMEEAALNALHNQRHVMGEDVCKFEEEFARYVGTRYAVSTSSGTTALQIALLALGISTKQEAITSSFSFIASANSILHAGGIPVFADIDAKTFNIDPEKIRQRITKQTKYLLPVHLYGYPCDMQTIMIIAEENNLKVVEDACQAHGAVHRGKMAGSIGDAGCFSFYPSKNMTVCGDGGMIVTSNEETAKLAAKIRDCGRKTQYEHDVIGFTSRLNTVNAAIGRIQLTRLDEWNRKRLEHASAYDTLLSDVEDVALPPKATTDTTPVYHLYVIKAKNRDRLKQFLQNEGVQCGVHYPLPIPLQPIYKQLFGFKEGEYPVSERVSTSCLSLPIYPDLTRSDIEYISAKIHEFYEKPN